MSTPKPLGWCARRSDAFIGPKTLSRLPEPRLADFGTSGRQTIALPW
jgi:hypothetical protein